MNPLVFRPLLEELLAAVDKTVEAAVKKALTARELAPTMAPPLLDKRQLAQALGISTAKVDRMTRDGAITFIMVGDVRRYDLAEVRSSLAARTRQPAPMPATANTEVRRLSRRGGGS